MQYNTAGGTVEVSTTEQDGQAQLLVSNTGPTIPATEIAALFDPFHRHSERTTASNGTGLGLSIVNAVVQAHHGTVDAGPRDGGGLTIRVTLPSSLLSTVMRPAVAQ